MALIKHTIMVKIQDMDTFKTLVDALEEWALEVSGKTNKTASEKALFDTAVTLVTPQASPAQIGDE